MRASPGLRDFFEEASAVAVAAAAPLEAKYQAAPPAIPATPPAAAGGRMKAFWENLRFPGRGIRGGGPALFESGEEVDQRVRPSVQAERPGRPVDGRDGPLGGSPWRRPIGRAPVVLAMESRA